MRDRFLIGLAMSLLLLAHWQPSFAAPLSPDVERLDRYSVVAGFDPRHRQLTGTLSLTWTNSTGASQNALPFRLYPNAPAYHEGGMDVASITVDGGATSLIATADSTVTWVHLPEPVPPGDSAEIGMAFDTTIPTGTSMAVNVLHGDATTGWWLADWLPILAGWEPGFGWYLEPPGTLGNPTFATSATWSLSLTLPSHLKAFGTGAIVSTAPVTPDRHTITIDTAPARDLTLVLLPADDLVVTERMVGDIRVRLVLPPALASPLLIDLVTQTADDVLPFYRETLGDLPGGEVDLVPVDLAGFGGIAWSGTIWLDVDRATVGVTEAERENLRFVLAHELAHQWIPIVVGSNNNRHNFLSESLASHLALLALQHAGDDTGARRDLATEVAAPYLAMLQRGRDGVVDDPVASTSATADRAALVYGKGVLGLEAVRQQIGANTYLRALKAYASTFRFGISDPADLRSTIEQASGQDLTDLWRTWFQAATTTAADVDAVIANFNPPGQTWPPGPVVTGRERPSAVAPVARPA